MRLIDADKAREVKRIAIMAIALLLLLLGGCTRREAKPEPERINRSRFVAIENTFDWKIVADRETRVMYAVSNGTHSFGIFTLLVDADGKPLLWDKEVSDD